MLSLECISALEKHLLLEEDINDNKFRRTAFSLLQWARKQEVAALAAFCTRTKPVSLVLVGEERGGLTSKVQAGHMPRSRSVLSVARLW